MAKQAPNPIDVQEFQFKLHCRLKIFNNEDNSLFVKPCNLLACASQYGLIFIGTNIPAFQVITISSIEKYNESGYHRRLISLPSCPKHLAVNCDGTKLAVVVEKDGCSTFIYDVTSFTKQEVNLLRQVHLANPADVSILEICWNPTIPNIFSACKSDGTLGVYELKEGNVDINELPVEAQATCMSWSPKGKQIAVGSRNGKITQYKPDLKAMKVINSPPLEGTQYVVALQWISNYQFIAIFKPPDPDGNASLLVVDSPKTGDTIYTNYEDICYGYGSVRTPQFYTIFQPIWNLLMVASSNSMEVGVMGCQGEQWTQWILTDTARAELPLTPSKQESLPVGLTFDTASTEPVIWGETSLPPAPFLLILSHEGLLCCFRVINLKADVPNICQKPAVLPDTTGLNQFMLVTTGAKESITKPTTPVQPIKPIATQTAFSIKQPVKTESIIKPPSPVATVSVIQTIKAPSEAAPFVVSPITSAATPLQLNESNTIQKEADMLIANLIREECETLEAELKSLLYKASLVKIDLGTDTEAIDLVRQTDLLQDFLTEVIETNAAQSSEIYALKQALIQTWAWYEDARFRLAQSQDTTLEALLRLQQLDPVSQRYLTDIKQMSYYLESQLKQVGQVLDDQWSNFQDKCKKVVRLKIPTMETIYQAMVRHSIILEKQKYVLKDIANRNRALRSRLSGPSLLMSLNSADLLEKSLKRLQLEPEQHFIEAQHEMVLQKQKKFTQEKIDKLSTLLKHRDITNIKVNKPQLNTTNLQTLLQSSPALKKSMDSTLIGAGLSPITTKPTRSWGTAFIQSTPKSAAVVNATVPKFLLASHEQKDSGTLAHLVNASVTTHSQSKFTFTSTQSNNPTSAFVPTTQLAFSFTNKGISSTATTTTASSPGAFTFTSAPLFSLGTTTTTTTSKTITSSLPNYDMKQDTGATASSAVMFGVSTQSLFTPASSKAVITSSPSALKNVSTFSFKPQTPTTTFTFNVKTTSSPPIFAFGSNTVTASSASTSPITTSNWVFNTSKGSASTSVFSPAASGPGSAFGTPVAFNAATSKYKNPSDTKIIADSVAGISISGPLNTANFSAPVTSAAPSELTVTSSATPVVDLSVKSPVPLTNVVPKAEAATTTTSAGGNFSFSFSKIVPSSAATIFSSAADVKNTSSSLTSFTFSSTDNVLSSAKTTNSLFSNGNITTPIVSQAKAGAIFSAADSVSFSTISTSKTSSPFFVKAENKSVFGDTSTAATVTTTAASVLSSSVTETKPAAVSSIPSASTAPISFVGTSTTQGSVFGVKPDSVLVTSSSTLESTLSNTTASTTAPLPTTTSEAKFIFGTPAGAPTNVFGSSTITTTSPPTSSIKAPVVFGSTTPTTTNLFSAATTTTTAQPFGVATTSSIFGAAVTTSSIFGAAVTTSSIFGAAVTTTTSIFGAAVITTSGSQSVFGTPSKLFGTPTAFDSSTSTSGTFSFGTAVTSNSSLFASVTTASGSIFGSAPTTTTSLFGSPVSSPMTSSIFGSQSTQSNSIFGSPSNTTASVFGNATTTATSAFGSNTFVGSGSSIFGAPAKPAPFGASQTGTVFGQQPAFGSSPVFGSPVATTTNTFGNTSSVFGAAQSPGNTQFASSGFSKPFSFASPPASTTSSSFGFGDLNVGSNTPFGGQASNPFAKPFGQEQKPFGGGSIFATPSTTTSSIFGNSTTTFGFGSTTSFGSPAFGQQPAFGQSPFGSPSANSFSAGNQSVSQSGFGGFGQQTPQKTGFGGAPVFGGSPSGFGAPPTFGGSAFNSSFGSPNKVFGGSSSPTTGAFAASAQQQNPTFANLATQNTIGFGALAQQSPQPPQPNQSSFGGGSSFSTWR